MIHFCSRTNGLENVLFHCFFFFFLYLSLHRIFLLSRTTERMLKPRGCTLQWYGIGKSSLSLCNIINCTSGMRIFAKNNSFIQRFSPFIHSVSFSLSCHILLSCRILCSAGSSAHEMCAFMSLNIFFFALRNCS